MVNSGPRIGAHISIAGGIELTPQRAHEEGCEVFQCFTRSPQGGKAPRIDEATAAALRENMAKYGIRAFYIHAPYYINFASLNNRVRHGSISVVREELERGSMLGAMYVVTHLGSHNDQTLEQGLEKVIAGLQKVLEGYTGTTQLLIEISAGSGNILGDTFEEIGHVVNKVLSLEAFAGVCFDTCHAFASGYDIRSKKDSSETLKKFDTAIGLHHLKLAHVNDSKFEIQNKKDRHEHIGNGYIGVRGFQSLLSLAPFRTIDWILETEPTGRKEDIQQLHSVRNNI